MLWYKLCILVILLSENVFGLFEPPSLTTRRRRIKMKEPITTPELVTTTEGQLHPNPWYPKQTTKDVVTDENTTTTEAKPTTEANTNAEAKTTTEATASPTTTDITTTQDLPTPSIIPVMDKCNTSLHSKHDLELIFGYFENRLFIRERIIDSFLAEAESVNQKHLHDIVVFHKLFRDKPQHLKHIVQDIRDTRRRLMPFVDDISKSLNQYPELLNQFADKKKVLAQLNRSLTVTKQICELTCQPEAVADRESILTEEISYDVNEFYCGSIEKVREEIQSKLLNFSQNQQHYYKDMLRIDDDMYTTELKELKIKLKNIALKEFGHTMYDILQLQDNYHHLSDYVKNENIKAIFEKVKQDLAEINPKILTLQMAIPKLAKYCKKCNNFVSRQLVEKDTTQKKEEPVFVKDGLLLNIVANEELQRLKNEIDFNYTAIFENLRKAIDEANSTNAFIDDIKPIQNEIIEEIKQEIIELNKLQVMLSADNFQGMLELEEDLENVLERLDEDIHFIENYIE